MPTKDRPKAKSTAAKSKPKGKPAGKPVASSAKPTSAKPTLSGGSGALARLGALASQRPVATIAHRGLFQGAHTWGKRWLVTVTAERVSRFDPATWTFVLLGPDGAETDRVTFENAVISKTRLAGDELVVLHGQPPEMRVEVFRQTAAGKLDRVAARPGDESTHHLWSNFEYAIAIGERLVLARHPERKTLLVYERRSGFELTEVSETKIVFGEKMQFVENEGFSGAVLAGERAFISGPGHKTGYQLLDLSAPAAPRVMGMVRSTAPVLQEHVQVASPDRFVAHGAGGKALVVDYDAANNKLVMHKGIDLGLRYEAMYQDGDEVLFYNGNIAKPFGIGMKLGAPPEKVGKITLPSADVRAISRLDDRVLMVCDEQSLLFEA